ISALMYAAMHNGNAEIIHLLVKAGADVNEKEKNGGLTPLMLAALQNEHSTIIKALLEDGADINLKSDAGMTAYEYAVKNESPISKLDIVQELEP
ncbi:MAG: ankyrin repeat domain-containing protein, partial [Spirochaetia bacterium]|nr:ankyrin repeat domain-containing protein [Spirochaetia bacterium]